MYRKKVLALCILALLTATVSPAARADINGQCDPYSAVIPLGVAVVIGVRILWATANSPAGAAAIGAGVTYLLMDDDDDDTVPQHDHPVPEHNHDIPLHFHPDDENEQSSKGEEPEENPESPEAPPEGGGTDASGGYASCPSNPYEF